MIPKKKKEKKWRYGYGAKTHYDHTSSRDALFAAFASDDKTDQVEDLKILKKTGLYQEDGKILGFKVQG